MYKVLIIHNFYKLHGGEKIAVKSLVDLLERKGHKVVQYTRDNREIDSLRKLSYVPAETISSNKTVREVNRLITKERPDVAHVHNVFPLISPSVYPALKQNAIPIVQTMHNFRFLCPNGLFYTQGQICERCKRGNTIHAVRFKCFQHSYPRSIVYASAIWWHRYRKTFNLIDHFITLTEFTAAKLAESGIASRAKISVLGNFISAPLPRPGSSGSREPEIVYIGRLSPEKGVATLIEAMGFVPNARLKIIGEGPQQGELMNRVKQLKLDNVEFLGFISGEEKWRLLRRASFCVVPSESYENFSLAALESMAVGTPVVAANLGGLPYVVKDGKTGMLFEAGNTNDLGSKLLAMLNRPQESLKMGELGREDVANNYTDTMHYKSLRQIYDKLLQ